MNSKYIFILIVMIICTHMYGQETDFVLQGKVSFVTSKNIYVKFKKTDLIKIGDTLLINNTPCLIVNNKSSSSVVCSKISDCDIKKDDEVTYKYSVEVEEVVENETIEDDIGISYNDSIKAINPNSKKAVYAENIKARLSASSYSDFSSIRDDRHRIMSRFSLNANHINNSKYSIET